jgi:DNA-directed RNA polymerase subunit RPC12/RpoP
MGMIRHRCSKCGKELWVPDRFLGRDLKCTGCGQPFRVEPEPLPSPESAVEAFSAEAPVAATGAPPAAVQVTAPSDEFDVQQEVTIRAFDVSSVIKVMAVFNAVGGLLVGGIVAVGILAGVSMARTPLGFGVPFALGIIVGAPIAYGVIGAVVGALGALFYNLLGATIGGLKVRVSGLLPPVAGDLPPASPGPFEQGGEPFNQFPA